MRDCCSGWQRIRPSGWESADLVSIEPTLAAILRSRVQAFVERQKPVYARLIAQAEHSYPKGEGIIPLRGKRSWSGWYITQRQPAFGIPPEGR